MQCPDVEIPGRVIAGPGRIAELAGAVAARGAARVLVVTDAGLRATGIVDRVAALVEAGGATVTVHDAIPPNPSTAALDRAADDARAARADLVVAVGGGSALDAAKAVALLATGGGRAEDFDYRVEPPAAGLPIIAILTTAGTGAETNGFGVMESADRRKVYIGHPSVVPGLAVLDAELTLGLPARVTAATGFDAVIHGAESVLSRGATPASRAFAAESLRLTVPTLRRAVTAGDDLEARSRMLIGAHLAGRALTLSGLGLVHGVAHSVTAAAGTPHGVALAAVAGPAVGFGAGATPAYRELAEVLGLSGRGSDTAVTGRVVELLRGLGADIGLAEGLTPLGVGAGRLPWLVEHTLADAVTANSPRLPTAGELAELLATLL